MTVFAVSVLVVACDDRQKVEIGMGQLGTTNMGSSIRESGLKAVHNCGEEGNDAFLLLKGCIVLHDRIALRLLVDVLEHSVEPFGLVENTGGGSGVAVIMGKGLQDSETL